LVDRQCINPMTKLPLFGDTGIEKVQSRLHCFPIKIAFAKDTKSLYRFEYGDFFAFFKRIRKGAQLPDLIYFPTGYVINLENHWSVRYSKSQDLSLLLLCSYYCHISDSPTKGASEETSARSQNATIIQW
jgi:hypothetical protein